MYFHEIVNHIYSIIITNLVLPNIDNGLSFRNRHLTFRLVLYKTTQRTCMVYILNKKLCPVAKNMFCLFRITLAFLLISLSRQNERDSKRLLLNDPDVILARLTNMEHKMAQLQTELTEEKAKNGNLRQTMA